MSISDYEKKIFNDDYKSVYILYCVAIDTNKLLSIVDGSIIAINNVKLIKDCNYLLKTRLVTLGEVNLFILNRNDFILLECSNNLRQVTLSQVHGKRLFEINEFNCNVIDYSNEDSSVNFLTNIIVPEELELLSTNGVFLYSCQYDEYLNIL